MYFYIFPSYVTASENAQAVVDIISKERPMKVYLVESDLQLENCAANKEIEREKTYQSTFKVNDLVVTKPQGVLLDVPTDTKIYYTVTYNELR